MKLTYTTGVDDYWFERYVFEGDVDDIIKAANVIWDAEEFGSEDEEPDRCPKCGGVVDGVCKCEPEGE